LASDLPEARRPKTGRKIDRRVSSPAHQTRAFLANPPHRDTDANIDVSLNMLTASRIPNTVSSPDGYAEVARWMSEDPDNETLVFRKFDELTIHNLLYLQSEVLELEERLHMMNKAVSGGYDMDQKDAAREWEVLKNHDAGDNDRPEVVEAARKRMSLILEMRSKLKEYREF
jgi:hypothetical protein